MGIQVRQAINRTELEAAYDLWATVFDEERAFFQERIDYDPFYALETTFIARVDGELAGAIQIFPYEAYWGAARVLVGGIGNVATLPRFRGRGIAQLILRQQILWMDRMGFDLSHLFTGIPTFYAQMGWRTFADGEGYRIADGPPGPPPSDLRIREGDFVRDRTILADLYDAASPAVTLAWVRTPGYWKGLARWQARLKPLLWIAEQGGEALAYVVGGRRRDQSPYLREAIVRPGFETALRPLLETFQSRLGVPDGLTVRLPPGHPLTKGTSPAPVRSGAMWRLFDPVRLLRRLEPELTRRWRAADGPDRTLAIGIGENPVFLLRAQGDEIRVVPPSPAQTATDEALFLAPDDFLALAITGVPEHSPAAGDPFLRALFPKAVPFLWEADHF